MRMSSEKFSLSWNEFGTCAQSTFRNLIDDKDFTDVTLVSCDRKQIKAHKVILSSCSQFFHQILLENPHQHPLLFLKDIRHSDLLSIVKFIYLGQTEVTQEDLNHFMEAAEVLEIQGLNENEKPIPKTTDDTNQFTTFRTETNHEPDPDSYALVNEPFVEEFSPQLYDAQEEEEKYFETRVTNLNRNADGKFSCDRCEYRTKNSAHLRAHKIGKHEGIKFKCDQCDRQFSSKTNLQAHQHSKHEGKIYSCKECSFESSASASLSQHKAKLHRQW